MYVPSTELPAQVAPEPQPGQLKLSPYLSNFYTTGFYPLPDQHLYWSPISTSLNLPIPFDSQTADFAFGGILNHWTDDNLGVLYPTFSLDVSLPDYSVPLTLPASSDEIYDSPSSTANVLATAPYASSFQLAMDECVRDFRKDLESPISQPTASPSVSSASVSSASVSSASVSGASISGASVSSASAAGIIKAQQ